MYIYIYISDINVYMGSSKDIYKYVNRSTFLKNLKVEITQVSISDEMDSNIAV